nr:thiamine diphosphokinase [Oceanicola granulosus]
MTTLGQPGAPEANPEAGAAIVRSTAPITLAGGGTVSETALSEALALAPRLVAADGGGDSVLELGRMPEAVIGDMDSLSAAAAARLEGRLHRVAEQETTDFDKALRAIDAPLVIAVGMTGGRFDHELAAMNVLVRRAAHPCLLLGGEDVTFLAPPRLALPLAAGVRVSLFPMREITGRSQGLRWPIDGLTLAPDGRIGTSNEATGPVRLEVAKPGLLVILPRAELALAVAALLDAAPWR